MIELDYHVQWQNPEKLNIFRGYTSKWIVNATYSRLLAIDCYEGKFRIEKILQRNDNGFQNGDGFLKCPEGLSKEELIEFFKKLGLNINLKELRSW